MKMMSILLCLIAVGCAGLSTAIDNLTEPAGVQEVGEAVDTVLAGTPLERWLAPVGGGAGALGLALAVLNARRQGKNEEKQTRKRGEQWEAFNQLKESIDQGGRRT